MLLNVQQRGMHCLLRVCFCRVALSSVSIEVFLAVTAIAVTAVDNLGVLGCFLNDTEVRFACKAKLTVLNDAAFISQSSKSSSPIEIGEASIHNFLYFNHCTQFSLAQVQLQQFSIWGVSRKLATSVNQGDTILTMMDVLKCTQIKLLKSY